MLPCALVVFCFIANSKEPEDILKSTHQEHILVVDLFDSVQDSGSRAIKRKGDRPAKEVEAEGGAIPPRAAKNHPGSE